MSRNVRVTGLSQIVRNLNKEIRKFKGQTKAGLWEAALMIQRESQKNTPIDTGNLRSGAFTEAYDISHGPGAMIGYTASYAPFVHEINANYRVGHWKFLEMALRKLAVKVLQTITAKAKIR
jgi:hypothetical protein